MPIWRDIERFHLHGHHHVNCKRELLLFQRCNSCRVNLHTNDNQFTARNHELFMLQWLHAFGLDVYSKNNDFSNSELFMSIWRDIEWHHLYDHRHVDGKRELLLFRRCNACRVNLHTNNNQFTARNHELFMFKRIHTLWLGLHEKQHSSWDTELQLSQWCNACRVNLYTDCHFDSSRNAELCVFQWFGIVGYELHTIYIPGSEHLRIFLSQRLHALWIELHTDHLAGGHTDLQLCKRTDVGGQHLHWRDQRQQQQAVGVVPHGARQWQSDLGNSSDSGFSTFVLVHGVHATKCGCGAAIDLGRFALQRGPTSVAIEKGH
jgi:hypothetical protein